MTASDRSTAGPVGPEPTGPTVRYLADAVVPCDGSGPVLRPGVVEVTGGTVTHVGRAGSPDHGSPPGRSGSAVRSSPAWSTSTATRR